MLKLYEIRAEYDSLISEAEAVAAENDGVIPDWLADRIDELGESLEAKAANCGHVYKNATSEAEAIALEIKRLTARKRSCEALADSMKLYLSRCVLPGMRIDLPSVAISWRSSEETVIDDMAALPQEYCKVEFTPRKTEIKKAIKGGAEIPGCHIEQKSNIQIR